MKLNFDDEFQVPIPFLKCFNKVICIRHDPQIKLLKDRSWHLCRNCGFQRSTDEFKKVVGRMIGSKSIFYLPIRPSRKNDDDEDE